MIAYTEDERHQEPLALGLKCFRIILKVFAGNQTRRDSDGHSAEVTTGIIPF